MPGRDPWNALDPNPVRDERGTPGLNLGSFRNGIRPVPLQASDFAWARDAAGASQGLARNGKLYRCTAGAHGTVRGKASGAAVADNPAGPFKDARRSALITNDLARSKITW